MGIMRSLLSLLCLPLLLVFAGCSTPPNQRLDSPAIQVTGLTTAGDGYILALRLINPNTVPMVVSHSTHTLYLGEKRIGRIADAEPIGLPPLGGVPHTVTLPAAPAAEVRAWFSKNPGDVRATVESALVIVIGHEDDDITLKSRGAGNVKAP